MGDYKDNNIGYINLTKKTVTVKPITQEMRKKYLGGVGLNAKLLLDSKALESDPLSPENVLIFGVGVGTGTGLLASNRCTITGKSPLTDIYGDTNVGGDFPVKQRSVGFDHLVFEGKSDKPVYILIEDDNKVSILDASDLWGLDTFKTTDILTERHGKKAEVACIGTAGENLIKFACVIMSKCHAGAKTGMGCVMGSKNLKAIVVAPSKTNIPVYDRELLSEMKKYWLKKSKKSVICKSASIDGTLFLVEQYDKSKCNPILNSQTLSDDRIKNLYSENFKFVHQTGRHPCFACPVGCSKLFEIKDGKFAGEKGEKIDYGTVAGLGSIIGVFDYASILHLKNVTDELGIDTIETGGTIGLIQELYERGVVTKEQADGIDIKFGNVDAIETMLRKIAVRDGIGNILADGSFRASQKLNGKDYLFAVRKVSTGLLSKGRKSLSLGYITSTRGGDHLKSFPFTTIFVNYFSALVAGKIFGFKKPEDLTGYDKKGRTVWWHENYKTVVDALGICLFAMQGLPSTGCGFYDDFKKVMKSLCGVDMTEEDVFYASERTYQIQNAFNVANGITIDDYKWPQRKEENGINKDVLEDSKIERDLPGMLPEYFHFRGLTDKGYPTKTRLKELGLEEVIERLKISDNKDEKVESIPNLLKMAKLTMTLTPPEKFKNFIISSLLVKLLDLKNNREEKMFKMKKMKEKKVP